MSSDGEMYHCPVDGCPFGPAPYNSVVGHYSSKTDGEHPGGIGKINELLAGSKPDEPGRDSQEPEQEPSQQAPDNQPDAQTDSKQAQQPRDAGSSSNPVMGRAEPYREPDPVQQPGQQGGRPDPAGQGVQTREKRCLDCGGELVDFRDLETGYWHEVQGVDMFVGGDYICEDCQTWWNDE